MMNRLSAYVLTFILLALHIVDPAYGAERRHTLEANSRLTVHSTGALITVANRDLQFYDKDGKLLHSKKLRGNESVSLPKNGRVVGITRFNDNSPTTLRPVAFELIDLDGNKLYSINKPNFASTIVSPTGGTVVGIDGAEGLPESTLRFIDARGKEIDSITVKYFQGGRFSADGSVFVFTTAQDGIQVYSASAKPMTRFNPGALYDCSADGQSVAIWHNSILRLYVNGERRQSVPPHEQVRAITISSDGRFWGWIEATRAVIRAAETDTTLCELTLSAPGENYRSLALGDQGEYFAVGIDIDAGRDVPPEQRHTNGRVEAYTLDGRPVSQIAVSYKTWNAKSPMVHFVQGGAVLAAITLDEILFIDLSDQ